MLTRRVSLKLSIAAVSFISYTSRALGLRQESYLGHQLAFPRGDDWDLNAEIADREAQPCTLQQAA